MMPTLSCPTTVTMAFIAKFLMAARRQARRGGILLYTASVLYPQMGGKVNPLSSQRIDEWSPARRREGQRMYSPARSRARAAHSPWVLSSVRAEGRARRQRHRPDRQARRAVSPAAAKPQHAAVIARGVSTRRRQILQRCGAPAQPAGQHPGGSGGPEGQLAQLPGAGTLGHERGRQSALCRAVEQRQCQAAHHSRQIPQGKTIEGISYSPHLSSTVAQAAAEQTGKTAQGAPVGAPCWADAPGGIRSRRRTCRGWPGPPGSRPPHPAERRLGSQKY